MKIEILNELKKIEKEKNISILYACESGSRAWGFPSPDSDYDIRFIYKHEMDWYLRINEKKDFIDKPVAGLIDLGGWDISKVLKLIKKSNAVIWEWMQSSIIYFELVDFKNELWSLSEKYFSLRSACYHYLALCRNFLNNSENLRKIKLKKYFYILRSLLSAKWICNKREIPPMEFGKLIKILTDNTLIKRLNDFVKIKKKAGEGYLIDKDDKIEKFIKYEFSECNKQVSSISSNKKNADDLNNFFRKIIKQ